MTDDRAYRVQIRFNREGETFTASAPELALAATAASRAEAIDALEQALEARVEAAAAGDPLPEPVEVLELSGDLHLKVTPGLHRELAFAAASAGMSVESFAAEMLARAAGELDGARRGGMRPRVPQPRHDSGSAELRPPQPEADGNHRRGPAEPDGNHRRGPDRPVADRNDRGPPRGPGRQREGYRPELDDKGNFMEYLRNLEKGGPGGGRGGGPGRGRR